MKGKVEKGKGREGINWRTGASYHRGTGSVWEKIFEAQLHYIIERGNDMYMPSREQDRKAEDITRIGELGHYQEKLQVDAGESYAAKLGAAAA
jgi:hypothetical protein